MSSEKHERIKAIFAAALQREEPARERFLALECGEDEQLLEEVQSLLRLHRATGSFLTTSLPELVGAQPKPRQALDAGTLLKARYRIERPIAESGFATVYLAADQILAGKPVVIKLLDRSYSDDVLHAAFESELRSLSRVQHPNVVGISDVGKLEDATPFLVLAYVPGVTLREALRSGPLPLARARTVIQGIAKALAAAHKVGVWHLDLKPENIILSEEGTPDERVTVIDFGIARLKDLPGTSLHAGSPRYMAPEQKQTATAKSDLYSLARVAFEVFTGRLPESGTTPSEQLPPALGVRAIRAISKTLDADPEQRLPSVAEFVAELEPPPARPLARWFAAGLLAVVTAILLYRNLAPPESGELSTPVPMVTTPGFEYQPSFSPDGKWLFYAGGVEGRLDIYRKEVAGGEPERLTDNPLSELRPQCSPDGKTLAFIRAYPEDATIALKPLDPAGPETEIARWREFDSLTWSPDGNFLVVSEDFEGTTRRLILLNVRTGEKREMIGAPLGASGDIRPAFSPDGGRMAFVRRWDQGSSDIFVAGVDASLRVRGAPRQITHGRERIESVQWTPDGKDLLFVAGPLHHGSLWRVSANGGEPAPVLVGAGRIESIAIPPHQWKLAYGMLLSDTNIWRLLLGPAASSVSPPELVVAGSYEDREPRLSPDGVKLAFVSARSGEEQAWLSASDGSNPRKLTSFANPDSVDVAWLRDSTALLVSVRSKALGRRIYQVPADPKRDLTELVRDGLAASVSRDGRWVYFCRRSDRKWQLWRAEIADPSHIEQMTTDGGYYGVESADGRFLYFTKQSEAEGIWRKPLPAGQATLAVDSLYRRDLFAPAAKGLLYVGAPPGAAKQSLFFKPNGDAVARLVYTFERDVFWGLDLSPDERSLLFSQYDVSNSDIMLVESFR